MGDDMVKKTTYMMAFFSLVMSWNVLAELPRAGNKTTQEPTTMPGWYNQGYQNYGNQYQDPYYNQNMYNQNATTMNFGNQNMTLSGSASDLFTIFKATDGNLGKKLSATLREGYVRPMMNNILAGLIAKLPKFSFALSTSQQPGSGSPMLGMDPRVCDPFYAQKMYQAQQQQRVLQ